MSGFKDIAKGGWHPKGNGEGGRESWRGDFKGVNKVAGWMGKGKDPSAAANNHVSAPLSSLKDPASFGPPPKRTNYGDPPVRPRPARQQESVQAQPSVVEQPTKPKPNLPPRLPPRQNSHPDAHSPAPPPPYTETTPDNGASGGYLNQGALNRLGQAGISVPGLDIGRNASPPVPPRQTASPSLASLPPVPNRNTQLSELQNRFAKMPTPSSSSPSAPPSTGTTWAEKQAALRTANNLQSDPSKVSLSDVRSAASTANNFRERHGEQAAAGLKAANNLNQKYDIAGRVNSIASITTASPQSPTRGLGKKPPPPPPPKKKDGVGSGEPPPVPLGSKPKF